MSGESRFPLPSDTAHVRIEARQYNVGRFDLGEGVARRKLLVGAAIIVPCWLLLGVVFGVPVLRYAWAYIVPPALLALAALRPDAGGRPHYVLWLDRARYLARRQVPMLDSMAARERPGRPFLVRAQWTVVDPAASRRLRRAARRAGVSLAPFTLSAAAVTAGSGRRPGRRRDAAAGEHANHAATEGIWT
ncbi:hypothetical protein [Nakamurella endophytica]|uniref:Uncharacterized protein n=1 Tax=Nakamurella endophytica TaxID=1748367 RepID=A0A917TAD4_9ACTN|nr:hypothetical protein [Nakamurella endophytica]GGM15962.1 hypothetical protein GCM10011594_39950 [Nakamurella endophytica]